MILYLSLACGLLAALLFFRQLLSAPPAVLARYVRFGTGGLALAGATVFAARGGLPLAIPLAAFAVKLLFGSPSGFWRSHAPSDFDRAARRSSIRTDTLEMELDLDDGSMRGRVLKGRFSGRTLDALTPAELSSLWRECAFADPKSAKLIEAFLDRSHPRWREDMDRAGADGSADGDHPPPPDLMTRKVALQILGLDNDATDADIRKAHHELMKKLHPDHGGTVYLAAKINEARDALLSRPR